MGAAWKGCGAGQLACPSLCHAVRAARASLLPAAWPHPSRRRIQKTLEPGRGPAPESSPEAARFQQGPAASPPGREQGQATSQPSRGHGSPVPPSTRGPSLVRLPNSIVPTAAEWCRLLAGSQLVDGQGWHPRGPTLPHPGTMRRLVLPRGGALRLSYCDTESGPLLIERLALPQSSTRPSRLGLAAQ